MQKKSILKISKPLKLLAIILLVLFSVKLLLGSNLFDNLMSLISGINVNRVSSQSAKSLRYIRPEMIRLDGFPWDIVEPKKGKFNYTMPDKVMKWVRNNDLDALGIIQYAPGWANGQDFKTPPNLGIQNCGIPDPGNDPTTFNRFRTFPPKDNLDFGNYAYAIAKRYKDVMYWQIWNEPNNPIFWPTGPNANEYADMLKAAYGKIKQANPRARVVLGGISLNDLDYINKLYRAGAKDYFDILAVHLYNPAQAPNTYLEYELETLHSTMEANGDNNKSIWLTEIGWHTGPGADTVSEEQQGQYLEQVFAIANSKFYIGAMFWNTLMDCSSDYNASNQEHNYGIYDSNLKSKPAADIMRGIILDKKSK